MTGTLETCERTSVGYYGKGRFRNDGGTHLITAGVYYPGRLLVGENVESEGTYELYGSNNSPYSDELQVAETVVIGYYGTGLFDHHGGTARSTIGGSLYVGCHSGSSGLYRFRGWGEARLRASAIRVGADSGTGLFEWLDANATIDIGAGTMTVGAYGTLAMGFNFGVGELLDGQCFDPNTGNLTLTGCLKIVNGATATQDGASDDLDVLKLDVEYGTYDISDGSITADELIVGDANDIGTFQTNATGESILVTKRVRLGTNAAFDAASGSEIAMRLSGAEADGAFEVAGSDPNALQGLGNLTLFCDFGDDEMYANNTIAFEVAGADTGDPNADPNTEDFCTANFVVDSLVIGRDGNEIDPNACKIVFTLTDDVNNGNRDPNGAEALYVRNLRILAGAGFNLNGKNIFFIDPNDPGRGQRFYLGDCNLDGQVDILDLGQLAANYNKHPNGMSWKDGDLDGDRTVGVRDLGLLAANYNKGEDEGDGDGGGLPPLQDYDDDGEITIDDVRKYLDEYGGS